MALILHPPSSSCFTTNKPHLLLHTPPQPKPTKICIKFQQQQQQDSSADETTSGSAKKPGGSSTGLGFGSSAAASTAAPNKKKKQSKGKRERASIIRREPVEKPSFAATPQQSEELRKNESAFLLAWLGLGAIILIEGIALAASGFLPEAWDNFFVKYLYPSFTPTVFLFVAGTVVYGVFKYLQNEDSKSEN